jgi:hypothetical protein
MIITAARTVDNRFIDVEESGLWEMLKIHTVHLVRYMWKGTEGLQKMQNEFEAENEGIVIPSQLRWLANPRTMRERRQNGVIATSTVVFVIKWSKVAQSLIEKGIKEAEVQY